MPTSTRRISGARRLALGAAAVAGFVLLWKLASLAEGKDIILPSPERVLREALGLYPSRRFVAAFCATFFRGLAAFALSALLGGAAGLAAGLYPSVSAFLAPLLTIARATPVLAIILLALMWFPSGFVPIFSAFLMAFPVMETSAEAGVRAADPRLLEMAELFKVPPREVFRKIRLPAAAGHLAAGARNALGLAWKVVVAGEVLSQPARALGTGMQESRVLLETPGVFAWAAASILLCGLTELAFELSAARIRRRGL